MWRNLSTFQRTISERKTGVERKIFSLPYNQRTLFRALSEKSFEVRETGLYFNSKRSFHYPTDKINQSVTILSRRCFPLTLQRTFFTENLAPFSKIFTVSDSPSIWLSESEIGFLPNIPKKFGRYCKLRCSCGKQIICSKPSFLLSNGHNDAGCHAFVITKAKKKRLPLRQALWFCINYSSKSSISLWSYSVFCISRQTPSASSRCCKSWANAR